MDFYTGDVVMVPFGRRNVVGVIMEVDLASDRELKEILYPLHFNVGSRNCDFIRWVADYTMIPMGNVVKMMLSEKTLLVSSPGYSKSKSVDMEAADPVKMSPLQAIELSPFQEEVRQKIIENGNKTFLLHGVTGSGKTEVYLSVIEEILRKQQKQVLILFPEIALTQQIIRRIEKYFGYRPLVWNSNVTPKNKRITWRQAISGKPCLIVGARSALFIPFTNLGIIVVDEEHDSSYKQENGGFYSARDMAIVRGHLQHFPVILSSATPSLESHMNAQDGKYGYAFIKDRFSASKMPSISLIDMRQNRFDGFISPILLEEIKSTVSRGEQCLIYLNRRGYSPVFLCKSCGEKVACPNCAAWLTYHRKIDKLMCHHCNHRIDVLQQCFACGCEKSLIPFGPGVERIFEELRRKIPSAHVEIASSDTISSNKNIVTLFEKIANNEVDIVIGTQILAKGHHFPNITLVGVVDGDLGLSGADLRSSERTYQLINQVAGRAGREKKIGKILIQTFRPEHPLYAALQSVNSDDFIKLEIESRRNNGWPPFSRLASIIVSGTNRDLTERVVRNLDRNRPEQICILGPAPAPLFLLRGRTRWRFLLKSTKKKSLNCIIRSWISSQKIPKNIEIQIDIDPISFL
jgi:primosomal protein N' (replication factor Y)